MKVKSESEIAQSCLTLSDLMDCGPPGTSDHEIFQARVLEWGAIAYLKICYDFNNALRVLGKKTLKLMSYNMHDCPEKFIHLFA